MKQTDKVRREREIKRAEKKKRKIERGEGEEVPSIGTYINNLFELFFFDDKKIYNINSEENILELLEDMSSDYSIDECLNICRKAIRKTKVSDKESALKELQDLISE